MKLANLRRRSLTADVPSNSLRASLSRRSARRPPRPDSSSTKAKGFRPKSSSTIINEVRGYVDAWRLLSPSQWQVTPETGRLLQHWRHHQFSGVRPFFCQVEAVETANWLTEVAPQSNNGNRLLDYLAAANNDPNPELLRVALKLATGAGKTSVMAM